MTRQHVVRQGECLSRIARRYGFKGYLALWEHPDNAALRARRRDPDVLFPGDVVAIPERGDRVERVATGALHTFELALPVKELRVVVRDACGEPVANAPYALAIGDALREGTTDGDGRLREPVLQGADAAELTLDGRALRLRLGHLNPARDAPDHGVSGAQARLRNLGYPVGPIDGVAGPRTRRAVALFQRDEDLDASGALDDATTDALLRAHGS